MAKKEKTYDDTNTGALFVNDKGENPNRPDRTGKILINPKDFKPREDGLVLIYLAGWNKDNQQYGEIISLKASAPKDE